MNISELERRLREKEKELWADMTRTEAEARDLGGGEVQNRFDSSESKEGVFQETTADWSVFSQVRDALQRIERGTCETCVDCGRQIEDHRLDSVPWTAYCLDHQNRHERDLAARPV
ncbi:MAG TPA: TraR/DksA C4-type zinc finger protein [Bryobacteraceae bacterium]|nr:TraR/DksA C4-type zinc finger protein [Bryobacteraceae bacterium]